MMCKIIGINYLLTLTLLSLIFAIIPLIICGLKTYLCVTSTKPYLVTLLLELLKK